MKLLIPDFVFGSRREITPGFLARNGIRGIIFDIDNTLAPYEVAEPDGELIGWFAELEAEGIRCAFVSNNTEERVSLFNRRLGLPAFPDAGKPSRKAVEAALHALGTRKEETLVIGDQIFTDVLMAHRAGLRAVKVPPIKDKTTLFWRIKRLLEIPPMRAYYRREKRKNKDGR